MGKFLTSKSGFSELLAFLQKVPQTALGQCLGSVPPLTYYSYFREDLVIVSGQYLGSFRSILGSLWVVYGQKKTDWTAQSVFVIC